MRVFITGSTGLLGSALLRLAPEKIVLGASYNKNTFVPKTSCKYFNVDITKKKMVDEAINAFKPDLIIHTAAIATPDYCDKHPEEAKKVNVTGTKNLVNAAKKVNATFVYITTNGIYDGKKPPYDESSKPNPIDTYGKTKLEAEEIVRTTKVDHIIFRLITMYGWNNPYERQNPLTWQLDILGKNKTPLNMVNDMFNNFLSAEEAAKAIWKGISLESRNETYNIAGADCISRYDFSKEIARTFNLDDTLIYPVPLSFFKNFVPRPKNTCFLTTKMEKTLTQKPLSVKEGLQYFKNHLLDDSYWKPL
jgi:dTDP-4-dehydrorhamnose reductase